jgi:exosortase A
MKLDIPNRHEWRIIAYLAIVVGSLLAIYHSTVKALAATLLASDSFSHGFFAPVAAIWLAWIIRTKRPQINSAVDVASKQWPSILPGLVLICACGLAWLVADLAGVNAGTQFMLIGLIAGCILTVFGWAQFRYFLFPIAFLLFSVPFGEFMMDDMMLWTADATVWLLRLSGLAVFRDGLHFQLPSGKWSVVEACSGLRYLLAALPLGAIFAFTSYRSNKKRWVFMAFCFVVPLIANWLRAYMIVMIGHFSSMTLAVGVDHLIYGWLFFGLVIAILFWLGAKWSDPIPVSNATEADRPMSVRQPPWRVAIVAVLCAAIWPIASALFKGNTPEVTNPSAFSLSLNSGKALPSIEFKPEYSGYQVSEHAQFSAGSGVDFFAAMYSRRHQNSEMITWSNVLVTTEKTRWFEVARQQRALEMGFAKAPHTLKVVETQLRSIDGKTLLVWSWYSVGREPYSKPWQVKIASVIRLLFSLKDDSYFFTLQTRMDTGGADAARRKLTPRLKELGERFDLFKPTYGIE